ncbi:MAG: hypothetical protein ACHQD8_03100 [Chitinophagales bacterium]
MTAFSPGVLTITDDEHVESAKRWTQTLHSHGTKASFSLSHQGAALARVVQMRPFKDHPEWNRVVTATGTKDPVTGFETHTLTTDEIQDIVEAFGQAARRGKAAGFDAVRIQGCHAYLIRQFLSPRTNKRTDEYGGSIEKRARFACEVILSTYRVYGHFKHIFRYFFIFFFHCGGKFFFLPHGFQRFLVFLFFLLLLRAALEMKQPFRKAHHYHQ